MDLLVLKQPPLCPAVGGLASLLFLLGLLGPRGLLAPVAASAADVGSSGLPSRIWPRSYSPPPLWGEGVGGWGVTWPVLRRSPSSAPANLISAVFYDGYADGDADEALQLWNVGGVAVDVGGWAIGAGPGRATFPGGTTLAAGHSVWLAREADAFRRSFGHWPDWVWSTEPSAAGGVRWLAPIGGGPSLGNGGGAVWLSRPDGTVADVVVYGDGGAAIADSRPIARPLPPKGMKGSRTAGELADTAASAESGPVDGWQGDPVRPYHSGAISGANQVLYRKLDPTTGQPAADSDRSVDWASDLADPVHGRRARFPGWDLEANLRPHRQSDAGQVEVAVAPDALYGFLRWHLEAARLTIELFSYTFGNADLADVLADRARAGVRVRVLVDGNPAGGIEPNERWCLARIAAAGGEVYWLDDGGVVRRRYRAAHAKLVVIDDRTVLLGSENLSLGAAPNDDLGDGTAGHRGVYLATDAPTVAAWARELVARDLTPEAHVDLRPFQPRDPRRGAPAPDFEPTRGGGGAGYRPLAVTPLVVEGSFDYELISAPENALDPTSGLLGLLARADAGGQVLVEQLREPVWWGAGPADGLAALNPRLQAYIAAARRGARVRILLDGYFDDPEDDNGNAATVRYVNAVAAAERLDLAARLGNPSGMGIHNKMVLVTQAGRARPLGNQAGRLLGSQPLGTRSGQSHAAATGDGPAYWVHVGSLNGSEVASKVNRELALQVQSADVHDYLAGVFAWDWARSGANAVWLPWLGRGAESELSARPGR